MPCLSFFESDRAAVHRCRQPPNLCHSMGASDLIRRGPELWALQSAVESNATHDLVVHLIWRIDINILWGPHERSACWRQPPSSTITHKTSPLLSKSNKIYALQTHTFNKDKRPSTRVMQRRMAQNRQPGRLPDSVGWWGARRFFCLRPCIPRDSLFPLLSGDTSKDCGLLLSTNPDTGWDIHKFNRDAVVGFRHGQT